MPSNAIFYPDPQPQQGRVYAPIPAPGGQPPRRTEAVMLSCVSAWWPKGTEYQPYQRYVTAPIPKQGSIPPILTPERMMTAVLAFWPNGTEYQPYQRYRTAPIPAQGSIPPIATPERMLERVLESWPKGIEYQPYQRYVTTPIRAQGSIPPPYSTVVTFVILGSWVPPPPQPWQLPLVEAPFTQTYGDQPPSFSYTTLNTVIGSWVPPPPQPQQRLITAPIPQQGNKPPPAQMRMPQWPDAWAPQQQQVFVAATLPPIVSFVPSTKFPDAVLQWIDPLPARQRLVTVPIPSQGQTVLSAPQFRIAVDAWNVAPFQPQRPAGIAAVIPLVFQVPFTRFPESVLFTWNAPVWQPMQKPQSVATIPVISQVPFMRLPASILSSWEVLQQPQQRRATVPIQSPGGQPPINSRASLFGRLGAWQYPDPWPQQAKLGVAVVTVIQLGPRHEIDLIAHDGRVITLIASDGRVITMSASDQKRKALSASP